MIKSFSVVKKKVTIANLIKENQNAWRSKLSNDVLSEYYNVDNFKKGNSSLSKIELEELGNIKGKRILHLQCYFGLDSLSLCRLGAAEVVGLDFSMEATVFAQNLANEFDLNASFFYDNIISDTMLELGEFDIVFCSYGSFCWIPDINQIAKKAYHFLRKGGIFYVVDFHPVVYSTGLLRSTNISYPLCNKYSLLTKWKGTYASPNAPISSSEYNWNHSFSEIINSFSKNKFLINFLNEHIMLPMEAFHNLKKNEDGFYYSNFNTKNVQIPLLFSLMASKYA